MSNIEHARMSSSSSCDEVMTPTTTSTTSTTNNNNNNNNNQNKMIKDNGHQMTRFSEPGVDFKGKLIGVEDVRDCRGDKMCQIAMAKLKAGVKAAGEHKQRITINVTLEGVKLIDDKSTEILHAHEVNRISFISRDTGDSRAFGYVYRRKDGTHQFFGIKTEKSAEGLVLSLRDLFQVVFEMKKKQETNTKSTDDNSKPNTVNSTKDEQKSESTADETKNEEKQDEKTVNKPGESNLLDFDAEFKSLALQDSTSMSGNQPWMSANPWKINNALQQPQQQISSGFSQFRPGVAVHGTTAFAPPTFPGSVQPQFYPTAPTGSAMTTPSYTGHVSVPPYPTFPASQPPAAVPGSSFPVTSSTWPSSAYRPPVPPQTSVPVSNDPFFVSPTVAAFGISQTADSSSIKAPLRPSPVPDATADASDPFATLTSSLMTSGNQLMQSHQPSKKTTKSDFFQELSKPTLHDLTLQHQHQQQQPLDNIHSTLDVFGSTPFSAALTATSASINDPFA